ncbi:MAG: hypothetical protein OEX02_15225 [Cyclobacteriaceae bacterium]|nr:hypothetical protein [Cyclobacteriaceae bacterium]
MDDDYPKDGNVGGHLMVRLPKMSGVIIKDINSLLIKHGFDYQEHTVGGFESVYLFVASKQ